MTRDEHRKACIEAMIKFTEVRPVVVEDEPDAHNVFLVVEGQRFCATPYACETKQDAEWMRGQLCIALAKIIESYGSKP